MRNERIRTSELLKTEYDLETRKITSQNVQGSEGVPSAINQSAYLDESVEVIDQDKGKKLIHIPTQISQNQNKVSGDTSLNEASFIHAKQESEELTLAESKHETVSPYTITPGTNILVAEGPRLGSNLLSQTSRITSATMFPAHSHLKGPTRT